MESIEQNKQKIAYGIQRTRFTDDEILTSIETSIIDAKSDSDRNQKAAEVLKRIRNSKPSTRKDARRLVAVTLHSFFLQSESMANSRNPIVEEPSSFGPTTEEKAKAKKIVQSLETSGVLLFEKKEI